MARRKTRNNTLGCLVIIVLVAAFGELILSTGTGRVLAAVAFVGGSATFTAVKLQKRKQLQEAHRLWAIRAQSTQNYLSMTPTEFEHALAFLCERDGCRNVQVVGGAGDLGADVIATTPTGARLVIQAKRYAPNNQVKGPDLQKFGGTCYNVHQAGVAAVVTTSGFTKQAREYAGHMRIRLFGQQELGAWASRTGPAPWMGG
jgi:restriction system protein